MPLHFILPFVGSLCAQLVEIKSFFVNFDTHTNESLFSMIFIWEQQINFNGSGSTQYISI
jgi:hypothetical protein